MCPSSNNMNGQSNQVEETQLSPNIFFEQMMQNEGAPKLFFQQMTLFFQQMVQNEGAPNLFFQNMARFFEQVVQIEGASHFFFQQMAEIVQQTRLECLTPEKLIKNGGYFFYARREDTPATAEAWLNNTRQTLTCVHVAKEDQASLAITLLREEAYLWWETIATCDDAPNPITWEYFEHKFTERYIPPWFLEDMNRKFITLNQGDMSVAEYIHEFERLSKYAKELVRHEPNRCRLFENGLNMDIRLQVVVLNHKKFTQLCDVALVCEDFARRHAARHSGNASTRHQDNKVPWNQNSKGKFKVFAQRGRSPRSATPTCHTCGNAHTGECWKATGVCFGCGEQGHYKRNCPMIQGSVATSHT